MVAISMTTCITVPSFKGASGNGGLISLIQPFGWYFGIWLNWRNCKGFVSFDGYGRDEVAGSRWTYPLSDFSRRSGDLDPCADCALEHFVGGGGYDLVC